MNRVYTYELIDKNKLETDLKAYTASLYMLESLKTSGFKTINDAWRSICKTQLTKREIDKFSKLLGDNVEGRRDYRSFEWFSKYGGTRSIEFIVLGNTWKDNLKILNIDVEEDLNIGRHYCGNSYNVTDHTIEGLIDTCKTSIHELNKGLKAYNAVASRIKDYETAIEEAVTKSYDRYIADYARIVTSKSC